MICPHSVRQRDCVTHQDADVAAREWVSMSLTLRNVRRLYRLLLPYTWSAKALMSAWHVLKWFLRHAAPHRNCLDTSAPSQLGFFNSYWLRRVKWPTFRSSFGLILLQSSSSMPLQFNPTLCGPAFSSLAVCVPAFSASPLSSEML